MMELTVLGTAASYPRPGVACSGYLVRYEEFYLLVDVGAGSLTNIPPDFDLGQINAVLISHMHPDHCSDIFVLQVYLEYFSDLTSSPVPLYAPPNSADSLKIFSWMSTRGFDNLFDFKPWADGANVNIGPLKVRSLKTNHNEPTFALRITDPSGASITYAADTGPDERIEVLTKNTDLLLAEATWLETPEDDAVGHLSPGQAGVLAGNGGAKALMLTHFWPTVEPSKALFESSQQFDGNVQIAEIGRTYKIDSVLKSHTANK